jgi:CAAX protease family protein
MERKLAQPGFWMAVLLVVIALVAQILLSIPLGIIDAICEQILHRPSPQLERQPVMIGCINLIAIGAPIALGLYLNRLPFRRAFPIERIPLRQVAATAIAVLGLDILLSEADNVLRMVLPPPKWVVDLMQDLFATQDKVLSRVFLLVIVAPITEELLFRGVILRGLLGRFRPAVAVMATSLLFAAFHMNPWQFVSALCLGILFGWMFLRTGSLVLCVLAHAMSNALTILFSFIPWDIPGMTGTQDVAVFQPWWLDLAGLGVFVAGLWIFRAASPPLPEPQPPPLPPVISDSPGELQREPYPGNPKPPLAS